MLDWVLNTRLYIYSICLYFTAQNMKFSIKDFFSKCDQIRRKLLIWSHLLKKYSLENFIFCAVFVELLTEVCLARSSLRL